MSYAVTISDKQSDGLQSAEMQEFSNILKEVIRDKYLRMPDSPSTPQPVDDVLVQITTHSEVMVSKLLEVTAGICICVVPPGFFPRVIMDIYGVSGDPGAIRVHLIHVAKRISRFLDMRISTHLAGPMLERNKLEEIAISLFTQLIENYNADDLDMIGYGTEP